MTSSNIGHTFLQTAKIEAQIHASVDLVNPSASRPLDLRPLDLKTLFGDIHHCLTEDVSLQNQVNHSSIMV